MGLNNHLIAGGEALRPGLSVLESMMLVHRSRIDFLDVLARVIFSSPAVFKREALFVQSFFVNIRKDMLLKVTAFSRHQRVIDFFA